MSGVLDGCPMEQSTGDYGEHEQAQHKYIHVYTPTNGRPVREVSLASTWKQYNTCQTHMKGFHLTDPCAGFPSVLLPRSKTPSYQREKR